MIELDMQMPETCSDCPIYDGEYGWCNVDHNIHSILDLDERPDNCPLKERNHGKWIPQDHNEKNGLVTTCVYYFPVCSECGSTGDYDDDFCKHCGADMR